MRCSTFPPRTFSEFLPRSRNPRSTSTLWRSCTLLPGGVCVLRERKCVHTHTRDRAPAVYLRLAMAPSISTAASDTCPSVSCTRRSLRLELVENCLVEGRAMFFTLCICNTNGPSTYKGIVQNEGTYTSNGQHTSCC